MECSTGHASTAAIAGTATGLNVDANNRQLTHPEHIEIAKLSQGDPDKTKRYAAAACAMTRCYAEYPENSEQYQQLKALADWGSSRELKAERKTLYEHPTLFNYTRHGLFSDKNIDALKQTNHTYQITNRGLGAVQGILGTAAVAYVGSLCTNPLTCGLGVASLATNLDYANAGFNQMLNGQPQIPLGEQTLQNMGANKEAAALIYMGIGLVPAFTASTAAEYVANLVKHADSALVPVAGKMAGLPMRAGENGQLTLKVPVSTVLPDGTVLNVIATPKRILVGDPNNVAIIGRSMDAVNGYPAALRTKGIEPYLFSGSMDAGMTIPTIARKEFSFLSNAYGGTIPDYVLPGTKIFQANEAWAQILKRENYTVIDLGNPFNNPRPSLFFNAEQNIIFEGAR